MPARYYLQIIHHSGQHVLTPQGLFVLFLESGSITRPRYGWQQSLGEIQVYRRPGETPTSHQSSIGLCWCYCPTEMGLCYDCKGRYDMEEGNQSLLSWPSTEWLLQLGSSRRSGGITFCPTSKRHSVRTARWRWLPVKPDNYLCRRGCHLHYLSPNSSQHN